MKVWDITQPTDKWSRQYAKLEFQRIAWDQLWNPVRWVIVRDAHSPSKSFLREELPNDTTCERNGDCDDLELNERCPTCIEEHFEGLVQASEDRFRYED